MAENAEKLEGPDFEKGCELDKLAEGEMLFGHAFGEPVLVARRGDALFAIGATCTHYGGPPAKGLMADCLVGCPWHHARSHLRTGKAIDTKKRQVTLSDGRSLGYGALLLATGAEPVRLEIPGNDLPHVCYLRTLTDSRRIIDKAKNAKRAVVIGSSFIGLEVAWSLRERKLEVAVVGKHAVPLEKVLGRDLGNLVRETHEAHGVKFHLGRMPSAIQDRQVKLDDGTTLNCDLVVVGIGVRPNTALAEEAGIATDDGVLVNEFLETTVPAVFAAGDIARWPDPRAGRIRVEHWVVAQRQGQIAAWNMLGAREPFRLPPFFWSNPFDLHIHYVGHGSGKDRATLLGDLKTKHTSVVFRDGKKVTAVASVGADLENLKAEVALERGDEFHL